MSGGTGKSGNKSLTNVLEFIIRTVIYLDLKIFRVIELIFFQFSSMTKSEWFLDTFAAIVSVSQDELDQTETTQPIGVSKLLLAECGHDPELVEFCRKYCEVNNCQYTSGLGTLVTLISDILAIDAPRTNSILLALHQYRRKFTLTATDDEAGKVSKWSSWYWSSGGWSGEAKNFHVEFFTAILRFHRPGLAYLLETFFGPDMGYKTCWSTWLRDSFVSICETLSFGRELISSIASTGEPMTVLFLTIAILEDIVISTTAKDDVCEAMKNVRLKPESISHLWSVASEMAFTTPRVFSSDFSKIITGKKIATVTDFGVVGLTLDFVVRELLGEERQKPIESPRGSSPGVLHSVIADEDVALCRSTLGPLKCIAGTSISQHLSVFSTEFSSSTDDEVTVYIDARSEEERNSDNRVVVDVPITVYERPVPLSPRNLTSPKPSPRSEPKEDVDWYEDECDSVPTATLPVGPCERLVVYRFRKFVWMDVDEDQLDTEDSSSASYAFMKKLEFFRGSRICVVCGKRGNVGRKLINSLLRREFAYITAVRKSSRKKTNSVFGMIRDALVETVTAEKMEKIAIVSEVNEVRSPPSPMTPPPPSATLEPRIYSVTGSTMFANMKKQIASNPFSKLLQPRTKKPSRPVVPTLVLAPNPTSVPPRPVELDFEIGDDNDDKSSYSSVDL